MQNALNGFTPGQYLDINLYKMIGDKRSGISADTITIETDCFSTYAIVYKDTPESAGTTKTNTNRNSSASSKSNTTVVTSPKTADNTALAAYLMLAIIAGLSCILLYFKKMYAK